MYEEETVIMKKISLDDNPDNSNLESTGGNMPAKSKSKMNTPYIVALTVVILSGLFTGYFIARGNPIVSTGTETAGSSPVDESEIAVNKVYGNPNEDEFPDTAEGVLVQGGIDGEGSHHLVRQFQDPVYLTSSVVDLDLFTGHKVKVSGQTFNAKKAGWLMDAGSVKVLELNAQIEEE